MTTKTKIRAAPQAKDDEGDNGNNGNGQGTRKRRELTLDEMSLRAYKMTYEQLHGSKSKKTVKSKQINVPQDTPRMR